MLPTFLIIGAMKSGTTSLYHYLESHPDVYMPPSKELNYFTQQQPEVPGVKWYESQFEPSGPVKALGEASTNYTKYPEYPGVPRRIAELIPEARLVYLMRDPIERVRSAYLHVWLKGKEHRPMDAAIVESPQYVNTSRYALQIEQYLEWFPREQLLLLTSDELRERRRATMRRVFSFIGADEVWWDSVLEHEFHQTERKARKPRALVGVAKRSPAFENLSGLGRDRYPILWQQARRVLTRDTVEEGVGTISTELRAQLAQMLQEDVRQLRRYMGEGFDGWGIA